MITCQEINIYEHPRWLSAPPLHVFGHCFQTFLQNHLADQSQGGIEVHINGPGHMTKMATMPIYMVVKPSKLFFKTRSQMILTLVMEHQVPNVYNVYINDDPRLTLTYFTVRSN